MNSYHVVTWMLLAVSLVVCVGGCVGIHRAVDDFVLASSDAVISDQLVAHKETVSGIMSALLGMYPPLAPFAGLVGAVGGSIVSFFMGMALGKKKRKES